MVARLYLYHFMKSLYALCDVFFSIYFISKTSKKVFIVVNDFMCSHQAKQSSAQLTHIIIIIRDCVFVSAVHLLLESFYKHNRNSTNNTAHWLPMAHQKHFAFVIAITNDSINKNRKKKYIDGPRTLNNNNNNKKFYDTLLLLYNNVAFRKSAIANLHTEQLTFVINCSFSFCFKFNITSGRWLFFFVDSLVFTLLFHEKVFSFFQAK